MNKAQETDQGTWDAWDSVGGAANATEIAAELIAARANRLQGLDPHMYRTAKAAYLTYAAQMAAEVRVIAEWAERMIVDEAAATGLALAPFARATNRSTSTVSSWGKNPLQVEQGFESRPPVPPEDIE